MKALFCAIIWSLSALFIYCGLLNCFMYALWFVLELAYSRRAIYYCIAELVGLLYSKLSAGLFETYEKVG